MSLDLEAQDLSRKSSVLWLCFLALGCGSSTDDVEAGVDAGSEAGGPGTDAAAEAGPQAGSNPDMAYVTVAGTHEVLAIEVESREITTRYQVGEGPAIILAAPKAPKLYTANWGDNTISVIDTDTGEVGSIDPGGRPYVITFAPEGDRLYAGSYPSGIVVIDTATDEVVEVFPTEELAASMIVSPDGKTMYVATLDLSGSPGTLRAVNLDDGSIVHPPIDVGVAPGWITISKDGSEVYTLNYNSDDITVVDTKSFEVVATINTGAGSKGIIGNVTPDDSRLYVTNLGTGTLIGVNRQSREIEQTIELEARPTGVALDEDGSLVFITDYGEGSLERETNNTFLTTGVFVGESKGRMRAFDVETGEEVGESVETGPGPTSVVVVRQHSGND